MSCVELINEEQHLRPSSWHCSFLLFSVNLHVIVENKKRHAHRCHCEDQCFIGQFRSAKLIANASTPLFHSISSNIYKNAVCLCPGRRPCCSFEETRGTSFRAVLRAPRALTADVIRVPFVQDTVNVIRRSPQTYFDCSAFIDGKRRRATL